MCLQYFLPMSHGNAAVPLATHYGIFMLLVKVQAIKSLNGPSVLIELALQEPTVVQTHEVDSCALPSLFSLACDFQQQFV